ncbi:nuclear transport factor 2 family protein [Lysobacter capsici]|uniref:nuclear transport factor 2 family protein n=1 Tax=Lysobacter capsici TaxID=435897 RepID=UPI001BFFDE77|nr:nuclear transport factor 2 family protein [Lysobacter capsici]QWF17025.1 nuclear transport factor 2 family protein [Lysobacter capsici]
MSKANKSVLEAANRAISEGNIEGFLSFCSDDLEWTTVGKQTLNGKDAVRRWMKAAYVEPPRFSVTDLVAEADLVTAIGEIAVKDEQGRLVRSSYCDVWRFRDGKRAQLRAFVVDAGGDAS